MHAAKKLLHKAIHHHHGGGGLTSADLDFQIPVHYGVPSTASLLAFDPVQRLLAVATLDGRIKVLGGDGIEGLLISPKLLPFKYIEFLQNQGFLVSISSENDIQVWNLETRCLAASLQWDSNITAFSVISGSFYMYIGDEHGSFSVVKYDVESTKLLQLPYHISANSLYELAGFASCDPQPVVGILPQPCSFGNRVLISYEHGLIILWDIYEARILFIGGGSDLKLKDGNVDSHVENSNTPENTSYDHVEEKEISALCWASSNGSILAVGYVDGDIIFWKTPPASPNGVQQKESTSTNIIKIQLSSAERRLPVIVLQWSASYRSNNECNGQLFIYGGDGTGSEEVLTVLKLEWSSGMETLKCTSRLDLVLADSFADMILLPSAGLLGNGDKTALFVLTNPGQLHLYDEASLSALPSQRETKTSVVAMEYPAVVPMVNPPMTTAKFIMLPGVGNLSKVPSEIASIKKHGFIPVQTDGSKWPLTGGVPGHFCFTEDTCFKRVYVAGYEDGSIRLWDATFPVLSLMCVLEGKVQGIEVSGFGTSISNLDFCFLTSSLAVGNESGLVCIYNLNGNSDETSFSFVTEAKSEDHNLPQGKGKQCRAVFSIINSPVRALKFTNSGAKLAVGFECGRVAVLEMTSTSILFFTDCVSASISPVISLIWIHNANDCSFQKSPKHSKNDSQDNLAKEVMFVLTNDATLNAIDGDSGSFINSRPWQPKKKSIAFSMYVIEDGNFPAPGIMDEKQQEASSQDATIENESMHKTTQVGIGLSENDHTSSAVAPNGKGLMDSLILICCKDSLRLYSTKSIILGNKKAIRKVKHAKSCYWTSTLKKDDKVCGLALLFQTGLIEIRSFPDLELVKENSLMSLLRWNFKVNMENMISSSEDGQIIVGNGCELAFISVFPSENYFRVPQSFPCLHDKVLAAAAESAFSVSSNQKKTQVSNPGLLGNIIKGFKGGKTNHTVGSSLTSQSDLAHLEGIFSRLPFPDSSATATAVEETVEIDIDDIEIDEPPQPIATSSPKPKNTKKGKGTERERLLGSNEDMEPRRRTPEEIIAKYRKAGDASSAAAQARNKLAERQEKLDRISRRTAELQSGAENFSSMANELVKVMEERNRKWWRI